MTGAGNNTYLVAAERGSAALIDAGVGDPQHLADLAMTLDRSESRLTDVLVTHGHGDHASGAPAIAAAHATAHFRKHPWIDQDDQFPVVWETLTDGDAIQIGSETLRVLHTPGHSPDHLAFWHEASG